MTNAQINRAFLGFTDSNTKDEILSSIATHYGISKQDVWDEVTDDEAEHLLDYLTGTTRLVTSMLMQRQRLAA